MVVDDERGFGGVAMVVDDQTGFEAGFTHTERIVRRARGRGRRDDLGRGHEVGWEVADVPCEPG